MRYIAIVFIIVLAVAAMAAMTGDSCAQSSMDELLRERYIAFLDDPTEQNEKAFIDILYSSAAPAGDMSLLDETNKANKKTLSERGNELNQTFNLLKLDWIYDSIINGRDTFGRLGDLVVSGNRHAIDLEFKLYGFFGKTREGWIAFELAKAIARHPEAFLRGLDSNIEHVPSIRKLVREPINETPPARQYAERRRALETVDAPELQNIKMKCLKELEN